MTTFSYPLQATNGTLALSEDKEANKEAIEQVILTRKGERVLRNTFGTEVEELTTLTELGISLGSMEQDIVASTSEYQPLAIALSGSIGDNGVAEVLCEYDDLYTEGSLKVIL